MMTSIDRTNKPSSLLSLYRTMVTIRTFEEVVSDLVEAGEIQTPCHFCIGQEAVPAGVCAILTDDDYIWGTHRSHGYYLARELLLGAVNSRPFMTNNSRAFPSLPCHQLQGLVLTILIFFRTTK